MSSFRSIFTIFISFMVGLPLVSLDCRAEKHDYIQEEQLLSNKSSEVKRSEPVPKGKSMNSKNAKGKKNKSVRKKQSLGSKSSQVKDNKSAQKEKSLGGKAASEDVLDNDNILPNVPPKVSVIMPVYNGEKYLKESVESVLNSTLEDIELICVNDGSKDSSLKILRKYAKMDSRVVVINQKNTGASGARQKALSRAKGEFVAFIDSDDIIDPEAYAVAYDYINDYEADIVVFGWRNFSDDGRETMRNDCKIDRLRIYYNWCGAKKRRESIYLWNKLYRRSVIVDNNVQFNLNLRVCEDEGFNLCVYSQAKKILYIPYVFYNYRVNTSSLMFTTSANKFIKSYREMWKYVDSYYKEHNIKIGTFKKIIYFLSVYRDEFWPWIKSIFHTGA